MEKMKYTFVYWDGSIQWRKKSVLLFHTEVNNEYSINLFNMHLIIDTLKIYYYTTTKILVGFREYIYAYL